MYSYLPLIVANHFSYDLNHSLDRGLAVQQCFISSASDFLCISSAVQPALGNSSDLGETNRQSGCRENDSTTAN